MGKSAWVALAMCGLAGAATAGTPGRAETSPVPVAPQPHDSPLVALGRALYFDPGLSRPAGRACASCHDPKSGFADPDHGGPTSAGAVEGRFGTRNAPTAAYARFSPPFHYDAKAKTYVGGQFWDGRANTLEEQAQGPLLNPVEMNQPDAAAVVSTVATRPYAPLFQKVFGEAALRDPELGFADVARAIASFERTRAFSPFSSKYDAYLAGRASLTAAEARGLSIFEDPKKGNCAACHPSRPGPNGPPLFTDFSYDNLGLPSNPDAHGDGPDLGLGGRLGRASEDGKFKVPTLRNIALTAPYGHNGSFASLGELIHFYSTRDVADWPPPEVPQTVNHQELGNLHLTAQEEADLVAFLDTLTDGYIAPRPLAATPMRRGSPAHSRTTVAREEPTALRTR